MSRSLAAALGVLAAWVVAGFVVPAGTGWVHLFLACGVLLLVRAIVTGNRRMNARG